MARAQPRPALAGDGAAAQTLPSLVAEALADSPLIIAARHKWQAAQKVPLQEASLPDPQVTFQNLAVGNPIPGHDLQSNNFAYLGYGVTQEVPFPTKLGLRGSIAREQARWAWEAYQAQRRALIEQVRESYFELFYLAKSRELLHRTYQQFRGIANITRAQYEVGTARQQDVLKAQLEMTSILDELQTAREGFEQGQANLKAMVGRDPDSPDIAIGEVTPTLFKLDQHQLRQLALAASPVLKQAQALEDKSEQALRLARQSYIPDLSLSYMYQNTGSRFPDYYMATVGLSIPLYFWRKQTPAIDQAGAEQESAHAQTFATRLEVLAQAQNQWVAIQTTQRVSKIYHDGLLPQARATLQSALAAYRVGKVDFQTLLSAEIDLLRLEQEYYRVVADHEIAIARISQIIGEVP
ncbi:MAG TPA: TolC family protein [Candidatus Binataceae bacterium]|nr:TolC family protein [Candidatus Binataceae bacterium]